MVRTWLVALTLLACCHQSSHGGQADEGPSGADGDPGEQGDSSLPPGDSTPTTCRSHIDTRCNGNKIELCVNGDWYPYEDCALGCQISGDQAASCSGAEICPDAFPLSLHRMREEGYLMMGFVGLTAASRGFRMAVEEAIAGPSAPEKIGAVQCYVEGSGSEDGSRISTAGAYLRDSVGAKGIVAANSTYNVEKLFAEARQLPATIITAWPNYYRLFTDDNSNPTDAAPGLLWRVVPSEKVRASALGSALKSLAPFGTATATVAAVASSSAATRVTIVSEALLAAGISVAPWIFDNESEIPSAVAGAAATPGAAAVLFVEGVLDEVALTQVLVAHGAIPGAPPVLLIEGNERTKEALGAGQQSSVLGIRFKTPPEFASAAGLLFQSKLQNRYGSAASEQDQLEAVHLAERAYDAAWLLLYASRWATANWRSDMGTGMAAGLRHMSSGLLVGPGNWPAVEGAIRAGGGLNYDGVSGRIDFDPATEEPDDDFELVRWTKGAQGELTEEVLGTISP
jgi:hypothetical protein